MALTNEQRQIGEFKRYLRDLNKHVKASIDALDAEMKKPSDVKPHGIAPYRCTTVPRIFPWGKLAIWCLKRHIAIELRPECDRIGCGREEAIEASCAKLRKHFDAAWPVQ